VDPLGSQKKIEIKFDQAYYRNSLANIIKL